MSMRAQPEQAVQPEQPVLSGQGDGDEPGTGRGATDRRSFVRNLALGGAAVAAGAVAATTAMAPAGAQTSTTVAGPPTIPPGDITLVNFMLSLELAASQLYAQMIATGKLSSASLGNARTFESHHNDHATALATLNADATVYDTNAKLMSQVGGQISAAADQDALMQIAFTLESNLAATHQWMMGTVQNWQTATTEASLEPVEAQHCVVWGEALDLDTSQWMPSFQSSTGHYDPATYAAS
jgi:hypothetical protein